MRRPSLSYAGLVGGLTSLPVMALLYLGQQLAGLPFVPFDLFDWLARYGMKQSKWITWLEAIDRQGAGYWVERGWSQEARPRIISIIDTVARDAVSDGSVPVGGIAWAGDRGIRQVEVQVDSGAWSAARLLMPPLSPLMWVLWRYDWPRHAGQHTFRVRATDRTGALQIEEPTDPHPNGATGYHTLTVAFA